MSDLTSEKIAKALKGAGLSSKQRIVKAKEAWENNAIFFPNKDDFLFEWICSAFAKPNMKKMDDCCLLQLPYWNLLKSLLEHYKERNRLDSKRTPPAVHINILSSISTLLHHLYTTNSKNKVEFLVAVRQCLEILFSDYFALSFRPAYEQVSTAVDQALASLSMQLELSTENYQQSQDLSELSLIAQLLLKKFDSQLILAANQKKVFSSIVEKSLPKLLSVRRRISLVDDTIEISKTITDIICHALFHADTVLEFTSVLKDINAQNTLSGTNIKQTNYVVKLFETLESMVTDTKDHEQLLDALDIMPILFSSFLEAFRQKRNTSTSSLQDISRMAEFGFFIYLTDIIGTIKDTAVSAYLHTLCRLLKELLLWSVYSARNDEIAKSQHAVLAKFADDMLMYIEEPKRFDQDLVFDLADILLQIDFTLVETRIQPLWPVLLNPEDSGQKSCLKLAKSIVNTYAASRQMDVFIQDLIECITKLDSNDIFSLLDKPMFTKDFLNEFSAIISKSMPVVQALGIFKSFKECFVGDAVTSINEHVAKKQKKDNFNRSNVTTTLISVYFVEFTNSLKLSRHQRRNFEEAATSIYQDFIKVSMVGWSSSKVKSESTILPALQVHSVLINAFDTYFKKTIIEDQEWLAKSYVEIFESNLNQNTLESRIIVVTCANAMLQHVYNASLAQITSTSQTTDLINLIVDQTTANRKDTLWYIEAQWDGSLTGLKTNDIVKLACWKLLTDEWFDSICRFIDSSRAEKVAQVIYNSMATEIPSTDALSAQLLNTALLRSANFYEAQCFKSCNIQAILGAIQTSFSKKISAASSDQVTTVSAQLISVMDLKKSIVVDQEKINALANLLIDKTDPMIEDIHPGITKNALEISTLLKLLCLYPIEYYEKSERPQVLYLITLIDIWSISCTSADPLVRMRLSLMCRSLQLRFIGYFSVNSIIGMNSKIMNWLVSSNDLWPIQEDGEWNILKSSLETVTHDLDLSVLSKIVNSASAKNPDLQFATYLQATLTQRIEALEENELNSTLWKVVNVLHAINVVLANRKSIISETGNTVQVVEYISKISKHVITCLQDAKTFVAGLLSLFKSDSNSVSSALMENSTRFKKIKIVFHLTRLLQEYARIAGPEMDEFIVAEKLSNTLTELASPFFEFLQFTLSIQDSEKNMVLDMTTEFIASFCSILSRYQKVETTKRVLAGIWFVYTLVLDTGDEESIDILSKAFGSWVQSLSEDQYTILIESFVEQSEEEANNREKVDKERHHLVFLSLLSLLLKHCKNDERGRLRKLIPTFVLKLSLIAGKTTSLDFIQRLLKFLIQLTGEQAYSFSDYDSSILLSCLLQVSHPTAFERFNKQINRKIAHGLFDDVCLVLSNLVSQHKEQIVYMMPPFIACTQSLLHCFKSTHVSLVSGTETTPGRKRKHTTDPKNKTVDSKKLAGRTIPILSEFSPLDDSSAQRFARLLTTIPQKQHSTSTTKNAKSTQTLHKIISKHTPSILIEYFNIQSNVSTSVVQPSTKSILTQALYDILDMCSESDRTFILSSLDSPGKALFKSFYNDWKENHKYTGQ